MGGVGLTRGLTPFGSDGGRWRQTLRVTHVKVKQASCL
jgi:hypothetical protein